MKREYTIGSRGSELALWQANFVKKRLEKLFPNRVFTIKIVKTTGDQRLDVALAKIGDKGLFTREIEAELLHGEIDLAVHSLKDLQTVQPDGLIIGAVCKREVPNDAFISKSFTSIDDLPIGARVATGSLRRRSQLLSYRPDLEIIEIRGNVPTRLRKFDESGLDGLILAYAGLHRLGLNQMISQILPFSIMLPAVGQGAVAVEIRDSDREVSAMTGRLENLPTRMCITAERAFLQRLDGGCQVPIGALATFDNGRVRLEGMVGSPEGSTIYREAVEGESGDAKALGVALAERLIDRGAENLLSEARSQAIAVPQGTMP